MIDIKGNKLKISVRRLVEFLCRGGDIDNRFGGVTDKNAMEAGARIHKKIQKSMGPDYRAEVPLCNIKKTDNYEILVEGRADGIFEKNGTVIIDEIKGTYRDIKYLTGPADVHRAQAMCYAYFYAVEEGLESIGIRLTYANLDDESVKYFEEYFTFTQIEKWYFALIEELCKWGDYVFFHKEERNKSIGNLDFPFEYRPGQRNLAVSVYKAIRDSQNLFIQAPTGVGKTISTVFPAVKAMGDCEGDKIFYLTAKTITRTVAEETFDILRQNGLVFNSITITAKDKICCMEFDEGPQCNPVMCPYAQGHFDRVNEAVFDIITHEKVITRQVIEEYANKHTVCPFEFSLDISYWMDGIICDYNYAFDPHVHLKRFFADAVGGDYIFLVDEAHNLVDRARNMYSAGIVKEDILAIKRLVGLLDKRLTGALESCNRELLAMKRVCEDSYAIKVDVDSFALKMIRLGELLIRFMENNRGYEHMTELSEFYFAVAHFNMMYEMAVDNYVIYTEHTDRGFMLRLFCVNPSASLKNMLERGRAAVFFSATLLPVNYYKEMLSGDSGERAIYAHSPFDTSKRLLVVGRDVTSRYTRRNEDEYRKIVSYIRTLYEAKRGNYLIFFPSYRYMEDVYACCEEGLRRHINMQKKEMTEDSKEEFLSAFEDGDRAVIGFCVMGGIFSEGIDLKEDSLIGAVIVGPGLPMINTEGQILRRFYDELNGMGYEYAYVYPGMNKVLQAAGRVIRTDKDRGVIALLDDRFLNRQYQSLFPLEWEDYRIVDIKGIEQEVLDFWGD